MIKAVLFDLFETLVTERGRPAPRASALGATLGLDDRAYRTAWRVHRPRVTTGHLSFHDALTDICTRLGTALDASVVKRACDERALARRILFDRIDPDVLAMMRELSQRGTRLATVSNCFAEDVEGWASSSLAPHFACAVFSFAFGAAKSEPGIYLEALRRLRVEPAEAMFVGDGGDDELTGAERVGLRAVRAAWFVEAPNGRHPTAFKPRDVIQLIDDSAA
jgi:FMN phosphatase YigB (HAD superfamily)